MLELFFLLVYDIIYVLFFFFFFILFLQLLYYNGKGSEGINSVTFLFYKIFFFLLVLGMVYFYTFTPISIWMVFDFLIFNDVFSNFFLLFFYIFLLLYLYIFIYLDLEYFYYYEYLYILMLIVLFVGFIFKVYDLMFLFILVEGISLCLYILVSSNYSSIKIGEAGVKYFILAVLSSLFFLFAISIIYYQFGTFNLMKLKILFLTNIEYINFMFLFSCLLLISSFFFKIGLVPFHLWVVEVYYGVSLSTFFFLSVYSKYIFFVVLFKLFLNFFFFFSDYFFFVFLFSGLTSIVIGIIGSLVYIDIKRLLAYGSIVHNGFIILSFLNFTYYSIYAFICYLFTYVFLMINFFFIFFIFKSFNINLNTIYDLMYVKNVSKILSFSLFFIFLSMAGIPPFIGFFAKFYVLYNLYLIDYNFLYLIFFILFINMIAVYVYLRFGVYLFFSDVKFKFFKFTKFKFLEKILFGFFFFNVFGFSFYFLFYKYCYYLIFFAFLCFI